MNTKVAASLLLSVTLLVQADSSNFFKCPFLTRTEICLDAARTGTLTPNMLMDLPEEDFVDLRNAIEARKAQIKAESWTDSHETALNVGKVAFSVAAVAGFALYIWTALKASHAYNAYCAHAFEESFHKNQLSTGIFPPEFSKKELEKLHILARDMSLYDWAETKKHFLSCGASIATYATGVAGSAALNFLSTLHEVEQQELTRLTNALALLEEMQTVRAAYCDDDYLEVDDSEGCAEYSDDCSLEDSEEIEA